MRENLGFPLKYFPRDGLITQLQVNKLSAWPCFKQVFPRSVPKQAVPRW